jgi:thiol-disulfide isomerase/thioredoxin
MTRVVVAACIALLVAVPFAVMAQDPILDFSVSVDAVELAQGGDAGFTVRVENTSVYEADNVEVAWVGDSGFALEPPDEPLTLLPAFQSAVVPIVLHAEESVPVGQTEGQLEFVYSYCIDDLCFQIVDTRPITVRVVEQGLAVVDGGTETALPVPAEQPSAAEPGQGGFPWPWFALGLALLLLGGSWALLRIRRARGGAYVLLIVVVAGSLAYGVSLHQQNQAQQIGAVLCTSCVGIEAARTAEPRLTASQVSRIEAIAGPIELLVFYAPWCHSCPFAEALVVEVASHNEQLSYRFVNVDEDPEMARYYGVIRSGRTVVPAIVRVDTGGILFGVDDLEERLVETLEVP